MAATPGTAEYLRSSVSRDVRDHPMAPNKLPSIVRTRRPCTERISCRRPRAETCSSASVHTGCQAGNGRRRRRRGQFFMAAQQSTLTVGWSVCSLLPTPKGSRQPTSLVIACKFATTPSPHRIFPFNPRSHPTCRPPIPSSSSFSTP
jgi:hypothetical protein